MCKYCEYEKCHYGEVCAWERGLVRRYHQPDYFKKGKKASDVLGRPAEWEHVIPKAVIDLLGTGLREEYTEERMYDYGVVFAIDKVAHRRGVPTTGSSDEAKAFRDYIAGLLNSFGGNGAVTRLIEGEVRAISTFRDAVNAPYPRKIQEQYVPALGAVLCEYCRLHIIDGNCVSDIYYNIVCPGLETVQ